jgi:hypothetical protein
MTSLVSRVVAAVRAWLGLNDPAENRLHPSHGWLLPPSADQRAHALELARTFSPAPASSVSGRRR